tara:strand:+ start:2251 stop:2715 length:465 start_codon:yes stop_codon:yes gene_type:complete
MARKKAAPKRAPEYETSKKGNARKGKPVGSRLAFDATKQEANKKKKAPVGKAKDGSKCFTRANKGGGTYVTCEGTQGKGTTKGTTNVTGQKRSTRAPGKGGKAKRTGGNPALSSRKINPTKEPNAFRRQFYAAAEASDIQNNPIGGTIGISSII